jgi:zinc/manganese transport system substrate-binding protein
MTTITFFPRPLVVAAVAVTAMLGLSACASEPDPADDGTLRIVASTNVYGSIATAIAGDHAEVTSIIDSTAQDPHSFEGSAQVQLALSKADLVIENGGGYDDFVDVLLRGASNPDVVLVTAAETAGSAAADNEHVWYSPKFMIALAGTLSEKLAALDPANADVFHTNAAAFEAKLSAVSDQLSQIAADHAGEGVAITEPVPLYLLEAAGLKNLTPPAFSAAIEEGSGISPALLAETLALFTTGAVRVLAYNTQTEGPETVKVRDAAEQNGIPVLDFSETLPEGLDFPTWMSENAQALADALE